MYGMIPVEVRGLAIRGQTIRVDDINQLKL